MENLLMLMMLLGGQADSGPVSAASASAASSQSEKTIVRPRERSLGRDLCGLHSSLKAHAAKKG